MYQSTWKHSYYVQNWNYFMPPPPPREYSGPYSFHENYLDDYYTSTTTQSQGRKPFKYDHLHVVDKTQTLAGRYFDIYTTTIKTFRQQNTSSAFLSSVQQRHYTGVPDTAYTFMSLSSNGDLCCLNNFQVHNWIPYTNFLNLFKSII